MKTKKHKRIFIIITMVILAGVALGGGYWYYKAQQKPKDQLAASEETKQKAEQQEVEQAKSDSNKNAQQTNSTSGTSNNQPSQSGSANVTITSFGQSGTNIYVNGIVNGATSGTCTLKAEKSGAATVQKSAAIGLQVSYYICQGFTIPASEFSQKGSWNVIISVTTPNGNASSETKQVTVQ